MADTICDVIVSDAALEILDTHTDFLARVSSGAATRFVDDILDNIASLSKNPQRFLFYENQFIPDNRYRRMLSAKRYLVIVKIAHKTVFVDYIVDCRQEYGWLIK